MGRTKRPTEAEYAILRVLWERGPSTVRQVHEELARTETTGYTTALKLLQIMTEKGLVTRDESARAHVYRPLIGEGEIQQTLVRDLLDKAFGGSPARLVQRALASRRSTPEELEAIRRMLDEAQEDEA